jgi:hypothetical protein
VLAEKIHPTLSMGEGGNSKKGSNYMSVDVSKWKKMFEIRKDSLFLHVIVGVYIR